MQMWKRFFGQLKLAWTTKGSMLGYASTMSHG